jgi:titin
MRRLFKGRGGRISSKKSKQQIRAAIESLEIRRLLATITVTSNADGEITPNDGAVTLREAITAINAGNDLGDPNITAQNPTATNAFGTKDTINFNISGTGVQVITPARTGLPAITVPVTVDGYSQPGSSKATSTAVASIGVAIDGINTSRSAGLTVEAQNVTIDGLTIYDFGGSISGKGIYLDVGSGSDSIWGNYLGTDGTSTTLGNDYGIEVDGSSNNTIGGTTASERNVISGNLEESGIELFSVPTESGTCDGNVIEGNYIGTDPTGKTAIPNGSGIAMSRTDDTTIGGTTPGARNLISGNTQEGVELNFSADDTTIEGNYIGVNADGSAALGNGDSGITFSIARNCTIGSTVAGEGNVISGNGADGIRIDSGPPATIINNFIGTDALGTTAIGNTNDGILLSGEGSVIIGGTDANTRNVISGNVNGIELTSASSGCTIEGNYIGTDVTGTKALGNSNVGVAINFQSDDNTIGGTTAGAGNLISGNSAFGIVIDGTGDDSTDQETTGNVVEGNLIGTDVTGTKALGDGNAGVFIDSGAEDNTIGGTDAGARNVISGIGGAGVYISGITINFSGGSPGPARTNSNIVEGNYIGTDITGTKSVTYPNPSGTQSVPFNGVGIYLDTGAHNNTIGGLTAAARNVISGNAFSGVVLSECVNNTVEGNYVGIDASGSKTLSNGAYGVAVASEGGGTVIGGTAAGAGNVISANTADGVFIAFASGVIVQGNTIGLFADRSTAAGNGGSGVHLVGFSSDNTIGGATSAAGNVIADNTRVGVEVSSVAGAGGGGQNNSIQRNSIYNNGELGIDLDNMATEDDLPQTGVNANDPGDPDAGANDSQNFPVIAGANSNATSVTVNGTFNSLSNTIFTLDFYASDSVDPTGFGEGKQYIGSIGVLTDANGNAVFSGTFNTVIGNNKYISATATTESTAPFGDTSEFSQSVEATVATPINPTPPTPPTLSINDVTLNEGNSGTTNFVFTVTRSGDLTGTSDIFYSTANGNASAGTDYTAIPLTKLHFNASQASAQVTVKVTGDTAVESNETFTVNLSSPANATITNATGTGTITNDDAAPPPPPPTNKVSTITDPCDSTKTAIEIDGTNSNDTISVTRSGTAQGKVVVKINNVNKGTFSFTGSIVVYGLNGNDNISIDAAITRQTFIFGQAGNDTISGGGGSDVIVGGDGNDKISGNAGRDLLFGGNNTDSLNGGADDDLLDAGTTHFDTDIASLCKLQDEWVRTDKTYAQRVTDITGGGGLNGSVELNKNTTFSSTTVKDTLTGGSGNDLFFAASTGNVLSDKASGETVVKIG